MHCQWKSKYSGIEASDVRRIRELENCKLKWIYADIALENQAIKDLPGKL